MTGLLALNNHLSAYHHRLVSFPLLSSLPGNFRCSNSLLWLWNGIWGVCKGWNQLIFYHCVQLLRRVLAHSHCRRDPSWLFYRRDDTSFQWKRRRIIDVDALIVLWHLIWLRDQMLILIFQCWMNRFPFDPWGKDLSRLYQRLLQLLILRRLVAAAMLEATVEGSFVHYKWITLLDTWVMLLLRIIEGQIV